MTDQQELLLECFIRCGYDECVAARAYNFIMNNGVASYLFDDDTTSIKLDDDEKENLESVSDGILHTKDNDYNYQSKWVTHATWAPSEKSGAI